MARLYPCRKAPGIDGALQAAEKLVLAQQFQGFVSGHDFNRADKASKTRWALNRLRKNSIQGKVLKGHDFSRANKANQICWALAPEECFFGISNSPHAFFRSLFSPCGVFLVRSNPSPPFSAACFVNDGRIPLGL